MNKFYLISIVIHGVLAAFAFDVIGIKKDEPLKLVEKKVMMVSLENRRGKSADIAVNTSTTEVVEQVKEQPKEEIKKPKPKKKLEKKKNTEKKKVVKKKKIEKQKATYNEFQDKNKFALGADGVFTAVKSDGIEYEILREIDPNYPPQAKKMGYKGKGYVRVRFTVNLNGNIEKIKFISGESKFGFKEEVFKALKSWKFKPIVYKGKKIKVNFIKTFKFR